MGKKSDAFVVRRFLPTFACAKCLVALLVQPKNSIGIIYGYIEETFFVLPVGLL